MAVERPALTQFRIEDAQDGLIHLVFDMPGRTMNVFSNVAIHELGTFARWLGQADVRGVVVRSGKESAFCAGADLGELGVAYDMIMAAPPQDRFDLAFDHFFPLSRAIRALETAGRPIAVAIAGLALGGGCEFALGGHYRVLVDDGRAALGLPESLVGLLPGAGGTQRLPRLIGVAAALPVLLEGARLSGQGALAAGLVHQLVISGEEVAAAENWLLSTPSAAQPWDLPDHVPSPHVDLAAIRARLLADTLGHYPAPFAILDCIEQGHVQAFDAAIRTEMSIFSRLIQRPEPRNMIQTLFLGKLDHDRAVRKGGLPARVVAAVAALEPLIAAKREVLSAAGFQGEAISPPPPTQMRPGPSYWIDRPEGAAAKQAIALMVATAAALAPDMSAEERRMADYRLVSTGGFAAYLGGPFAMATAG